MAVYVHGVMYVELRNYLIWRKINVHMEGGNISVKIVKEQE
jgi:hypothetical protein